MSFNRFFKRLSKALKDNGLGVVPGSDSIRIDFKNGRSASLNEEYIRNCHEMFNKGRTMADIIDKICDDLIDIYTKGSKV